MRVICDAPGQTCNRLWSYVGALSECIVKNKKMMILFYDYTIEDFPNLRKSKYIYFPFYQPWYLNRGNGWNNFKGLTWKVTHNNTWDKIFKWLGFTKGWYMRTHTAYIPQAKKELQRIFTPKAEIVKQADDLIMPYRDRNAIIVGVHIRRGDYATWNDGRFFFSHEEYHAFMRRIASLFPDKQVVFFISSNELIPQETFSDLQIIYHTNGSAVLDLHTLSLCDYIIGPFSTFSRWAAFIGEKPICFLEDQKQKFTQQSFAYMLSYFNMSNGTTLNDW